VVRETGFNASMTTLFTLFTPRTASLTQIFRARG
jgi:hypothetical protein